MIRESIKEIIKPLLPLLARKTLNGLEKNPRLAAFLKAIGMLELKKDFNSIYVHSIIEFLSDINKTEFLYLFTEDDVKEAFKQKLYKTNETYFKAIIEGQFHTNPALKDVKQEYNTFDDVKSEIAYFIDICNKLVQRSSDEIQLEMYNEIISVSRMYLEERTRNRFDFQYEEYLQDRIEVFDNKFNGGSAYVDIICSEEKTEKIIQKKTRIGLNTFEENYFNDLEEIIVKNKILLDPVDSYLNQWLDDKSRLLLILGEYGTGKTTLCDYIAAKLAKGCLSGCSSGIVNYRKYFIFYLREFRSGNIEDFIIANLNKKGIKDIDERSLYKKIDSEQFVLIFDGFDEMAQKIDSDEKIKNLYQIQKLLENSKNCKIILTSRIEYFESEEELKSVFNGYNNEIKRINVELYNPNQIKAFMKLHGLNPVKYYDKLKEIYNLEDLARRAVHIKFIIDELPGFVKRKDLKTVKSVDLYKRGIDREIDRKLKDLHFLNDRLPRAKRKKILTKVAIWLYNNDTLSFDTRQISKELNLKELFDNSDEYEIPRYLNDFLCFSFLVKESDFIFRFSHKSFLEYFIAEAIYHEMTEGKYELLSVRKTSAQINHYINELNPHPSVYLDIFTCNKKNSEKKWHCSNLLNLIKETKNLDLKGLDFSGSYLYDVDFTKCNLNGTRFEMCNLFNCVFDINIFKSTLNTTHFNNSQLYVSEEFVSNIEFCENLKNLSTLILNNAGIYNVNSLKCIHSLEILHLKSNKIEDLKPLSNLNQVKDLNLGNNRISDITPLEKLSKLTRLNLWNNNISDISPLHNLTELRELNLGYNSVKNITALYKLKSLQKLSLFANQCSDLTSLSDLKNLKSLKLSCNNIGTLSPIASLENLSFLDLSHNQITDISPLQNLKTLEILNLSFNNIEDLNILQSLSELKQLHLYNIKIKKETYFLLKKQLNKCQFYLSMLDVI